MAEKYEYDARGALAHADRDDLFAVLMRIMRAIENGHPPGHDAVVAARRVLKRVNGDKPVDLRCNCTPCAIARRGATNA